MPNGCDANGRAIVRVTASVAGSITLIVADCLFVTQTSPFGAMARVRGEAPTAISACFARVTRIEDADRVVVLVDDPDASASTVPSLVGDVRDWDGRFAGSGRWTRLHDCLRLRHVVVVDGRDGHVVEARPLESMRDGRLGAERGLRRAVVEVPLVADVGPAHRICRVSRRPRRQAAGLAAAWDSTSAPPCRAIVQTKYSHVAC